jgi:hypothetical protein
MGAALEVEALLHRSERNHAVGAKAIEEATAALVTREEVIAESCYLLRGRPEPGNCRLGDILTLDSGFEIYRWGTGQAFHLLLKNQAR